MHSATLLLLTSPLALALALPPRTVCDSKPQWTIPNVVYSSQITYSTPAHMAVSSANIDFNVTSSATSTSACSGYSTGQQSSAAFFAFPYPIGCAEAAGSTSETTFSYTGYSKVLQINETFTCEGARYLASATTTLDLKCKESVWNNPGWTTPGQIYSSDTVACEPLSATLVPEITKLE